MADAVFTINPGDTGRLPTPIQFDDDIAEMVSKMPFFDEETRRPLGAVAILANSRTVLEVVDKIRPIVNGPTSLLTGRERECIVLRTAALIGCDYEIAIHSQTAKKFEGMTEAEVESLLSSEPGQAAHWQGREKAIVEIAEAVCTTEDIPDDVLKEAEILLGSSLLVEAIFRVGYTRMMATLLLVARPPIEALAI